MLPKKVEVFGKKIPVKEAKKLKNDKGVRIDGEYCYETNSIMIDSELKKVQKFHTLIHEMGHVMIDRCSVSQADLNPEVEEIIVDLFATMMTESFDIRLKKK